MPQQDFFNTNSESKEEKQTLEIKFAKERLEWTDKVANMSQQMKSVLKVSELMVEVYSERQRCLEYYHYLISILIKINKDYRKQYSERHDFWTWKSNIRYPNENSKNNKIQTEIANILEKREIIENHSKFILSTCGSLDSIIFAIPRRIEIEQIARGK